MVENEFEFEFELLLLLLLLLRHEFRVQFERFLRAVDVHSKLVDSPFQHFRFYHLLDLHASASQLLRLRGQPLLLDEVVLEK